MIDVDELDLGAAEIRQTLRGRQRNACEIRVRVVDDLGAELDRVLGGLAGRRRVAVNG